MHLMILHKVSEVSTHGSKSSYLIRECSWLIVTTEEWKMRQTAGTRKSPGEKIVKDIKRATRKHYSSEEKVRIALDSPRGEDRIAELCRRESISKRASMQSTGRVCLQGNVRKDGHQIWRPSWLWCNAAQKFLAALTGQQDLLLSFPKSHLVLV